MMETSRRLPARIRRVLRSFRFRLTLLFVAILAVILTGFSIFLYTRQAHVLRVEATNQLSTQSSQLTNYYSALLAQSIEDESENPFFILPRNGFSLFQETEVIMVLGADGAVLQQQGELSTSDLSRIMETWKGNSAASIPDTITTSGERQEAHPYLFQITPLKHENRLNGYLIVGVRIDPGGQLGRLAMTLVSAAALILVLAFGGGYWLADRAMRPVHFITQTARQISESDLGQRLRLNRDDELGELADTFDQMLDRVQAAFERQRQFTADASHELRTPLAIIELESNRALERPRSPKEYEQALQIILSENEWMSRLVNELLLLARLDSGQTDLRAERLDLSEAAVDVVERLNTLAALKKVSLATGELGEAYVQTGRVYLARLINNLVENAIKYAQGDGARVLVETGSQTRDGRLWGWVRVSDNGLGITAEHIPHVFDRFYQIDPVRSRSPQNTTQAESGSGLGLAIVKSIAEAYGGFVEVKSEAGQGATFTVWLPGETDGYAKG
jgi:signal transduction histidine kinase